MFSPLYYEKQRCYIASLSRRLSLKNIKENDNLNKQLFDQLRCNTSENHNKKKGIKSHKNMKGDILAKLQSRHSSPSNDSTAHHIYYSLSPVSIGEHSSGAASMDSSLLKESQNTAVNKPEYLAMVSDHDCAHVSSESSTNLSLCSVDQQKVESTCNIKSSDANQSTLSNTNVDSIEPSFDGDFIRDGYCRCSFCNHDEIFNPNSFCELDFENRPRECKRQYSSFASDVLCCSPPWMKERRYLSKEYKESVFHKSLLDIFRRCEEEILQEEEVKLKFAIKGIRRRMLYKLIRIQVVQY